MPPTLTEMVLAAIPITLRQAIVAVMTAVFGASGGMVSYYRNLNGRMPFRLGQLFAYAAVGAFCGLIVGMPVFELTGKATYAWVSGGVVGILGFAAVDLLRRLGEGALTKAGKDAGVDIAVPQPAPAPPPGPPPEYAPLPGGDTQRKAP